MKPDKGHRPLAYEMVVLFTRKHLGSRQEQSDLGLHCLHMSFCQNFLCRTFTIAGIKIELKEYRFPSSGYL